MCPALVQLILFAEVHEELSRGLERKLQIDEVVYELTHGVEDDILGQNFRNFHLGVYDMYIADLLCCMCFSIW